MELEVNTPISAEAEVKRYVLTGDDVYVKRYTNENIPSWYRNLISGIIASDSTITDLGAAVDYLSGLPAGYNQHITELKDADTTINSRLESLVATTGNHTAAIASLGTTKVDATSAAAIARDTVSAYFANGSAGAWFNNQISTYASDIHANAMNISTLSAVLDGQAVRIDTVEEVNISQANAITQANAIGTQAYTWSANASKLITNPNGQITGWSFGDGSNTKSYFDIYADNFRIVNATTHTVPFSISGSDVVFNGKVNFTNVTNVPQLGSTPQEVVNAVNAGNTTTIDGGKITTGSITSNELAVGAGIVNGYIQSSDYVLGTSGFRLKSNAAGTFEDPTIYGAYIRGGVINGSIITGQFIDINSTYILNPLYPTVSSRFFLSYEVSAPSTTIALTGPLNGTGYQPNRVISPIQTVTCICYANISNIAGGTTFSGTVYLYKKINNGSATLLGSKSGGYFAIGGGGTFIMLTYNDIFDTSTINTVEYYYTVGLSNATLGGSSLSISTQNTV